MSGLTATSRVDAVSQPYVTGGISTSRPVGESLFGGSSAIIRPAGTVPVRYGNYRAGVAGATITNPGVLAAPGTQVVEETVVYQNRTVWYILGAVIVIIIALVLILSFSSSSGKNSLGSISGDSSASLSASTAPPPVPIVPCFLDFHRILVVLSADGAEKNGARNVHSFTFRVMQVSFRRQSDQVWVGLAPPNIQSNLCEDSINLVKLAQENRNVIIADGQGIRTAGFDRVRIKISHLRTNDGCPVYTPGFPPTKILEFPFTFFTPTTACSVGESIGVLAIKIHLDSSLFVVSHRMQPQTCGELAGERVFAPNLAATSIVSPTVQIDQATGTVIITGGFSSFTQDNIGMDASGNMSINGGIPPGSSQLYVIDGHVYVNIQPVPFPATWSVCEPSVCTDSGASCKAVDSVSQSSQSGDTLSADNSTSTSLGGEQKRKYFESSSGSKTSLSSMKKSCNCKECTMARSASAAGSSTTNESSVSSNACTKSSSGSVCACDTCRRKSSSKKFEIEIQAPVFSSSQSSGSNKDTESSE